ncbi:MAG: glycerol-3-phosphate acyltransferase, partial [Clostridia bacterium]|nr:glycerol-3-phosphate acyltransferase [Clostridia bacterium]
MNNLYYVILGIIAYLIGNFSSARLIAKCKHDDITKYGSGNPGTLNTWRAFGFWAGVLTFVLDMLKGLIPTLAA